jgi:hypothetical protein
VSAFRFFRLGLTALYGVMLIPAVFVFWAACSDYIDRGCPGEGINQCSDAMGTMQIILGFLIIGGSVCLALRAYERKMVPTKVELNA